MRAIPFFLWLAVIVWVVVGCSGEIRVESKPTTKKASAQTKPERLDYSECTDWGYIITDRETGQEYLIVTNISRSAIAITPMVKK